MAETVAISVRSRYLETALGKVIGPGGPYRVPPAVARQRVAEGLADIMEESTTWLDDLKLRKDAHDSLVAASLTTPQAIAAKSVEELAELNGIGEKSAANLLGAAKAALEG